ncbi:hypothetical protein [Nocardia lasii]|uniref:HipA N-terminal subdomain 1 domain-containing protein n=1 Tax=Nocardia lasii TaxID=1616107 RepID=A0ABW1JNL6_9NOCA
MTDEHTLHVVMNGRVIGDIQRTGRRGMRLRYADELSGNFTPLSISIPGPVGRYRESARALAGGGVGGGDPPVEERATGQQFRGEFPREGTEFAAVDVVLNGLASSVDFDGRAVLLTLDHRRVRRWTAAVRPAGGRRDLGDHPPVGQI